MTLLLVSTLSNSKMMFLAVSLDYLHSPQTASLLMIWSVSKRFLKWPCPLRSVKTCLRPAIVLWVFLCQKYLPFPYLRSMITQEEDRFRSLRCALRNTIVGFRMSFLPFDERTRVPFPCSSLRIKEKFHPSWTIVINYPLASFVTSEFRILHLAFFERPLPEGGVAKPPLQCLIMPIPTSEPRRCLRWFPTLMSSSFSCPCHVLGSHWSPLSWSWTLKAALRWEVVKLVLITLLVSVA